MRKTPPLWLLLLVFSACEIEEGSFDGSFWDDARVDDEDSGSDEDDAGRPPRDAGTDAGRDSGTDAAADGGGSELKPSDVAAAIARGLCGAAERCIGKTLLLASLDGNDCVDFSTKQQADRHLHWLAQSVDAERVTFRPERLADCERDLIALGCEVRSRRLPASCEAAVEGKADVTSNCTIDQDCKGNAWCDKGELESCPGVCVQPQTQGLPCRATSHCADGLICRAGNCVPPLAEGDECDPTAGIECPYGLVCQGSSGSRMCWSIESLYAAKRDEECDAVGKLCEVGLVCQSQAGTTTIGKCVDPAPRNGVCRRSVPAQCPSTQYCKNAATNNDARAQPGVDGVCSDRPTDGEDCIENEECAPGTACVSTTLTCRTYKTAGGQCEGNAECYGGLCEQNICAITTIDCP